MKSRVSLVFVIIIGSFCVYCAQSGIRHTDVPGDGPVSSADAQVNPGCACNPVLTPTVLFDQEVTPAPAGSNCLTGEIDISAYRTVVVHSRNDLATSNAATAPSIQLKLGEATGFVLSSQLTAHVVTVDPLQGRLLRFSWAINAVGACVPQAFTVVGYK